jgi:DNA processing protein
VPGCPLDPRSSGTNKLIKDGAHLLEGIDDILYNVDINRYASMESESNVLSFPAYKAVDESMLTDVARKSVINALSYYPIEFDVLMIEVSVPLQIIYMILLELELAGRVIRHPGNKFSLRMEV